jgi:hypothetical protein
MYVGQVCPTGMGCPLNVWTRMYTLMKAPWIKAPWTKALAPGNRQVPLRPGRWMVLHHQMKSDRVVLSCHHKSMPSGPGLRLGLSQVCAERVTGGAAVAGPLRVVAQHSLRYSAVFRVCRLPGRLVRSHAPSR